MRTDCRLVCGEEGISLFSIPGRKRKDWNGLVEMPKRLEWLSFDSSTDKVMDGSDVGFGNKRKG